MLSTVVLFLTLQGSPTPIIQHIQGFKDVATCEEVVRQYTIEENKHPVEPLIAKRLSCVTVVFKPEEVKETPVDGEGKLIVCKSKKFFGREVNCGKEA